MPEPGQFGKPEASVAGGFSTMGGGGGGRERALANAARNAAKNAFRANEAQRMIGGFSTYADPGTGQLNQAQFNQATGRTATNPYGYAAPTAIGQFFANVFGPENLDYSGITPGGTQGIATLNALALDVFNNPMAETNILGQATGANPDLGIARSGVQPGQYTSMGTAKSYRQDLSPIGKGASIGFSLLGPFSGIAINKGTQVTGIEDNVPISERTGEPLSEVGTGAFSLLGDIMTGGQSQFVTGKTNNMIDSMMSFFKGDQEATNIQPSDISTGMSAYSETGRPASGVPQLGVTGYGSPMAQVTGPVTVASSYGSPMAQITEPSASSEVTVAPGEAVAPVSNLTMQDTYFRPAFSEQTLKDAALANLTSPQLERSVLGGKISPKSQSGVINELEQRAAQGDLSARMALDSLTPEGYKGF